MNINNGLLYTLFQIILLPYFLITLLFSLQIIFKKRLDYHRPDYIIEINNAAFITLGLDISLVIKNLENVYWFEQFEQTETVATIVPSFMFILHLFMLIIVNKILYDSIYNNYGFQLYFSIFFIITNSITITQIIDLIN